MVDTAFVYCLTFPNGKQYVGVSTNPKRRYAEHRGSSTPCGGAFRKHGNPVMAVLVKASRAYCMELEAVLTDNWRTIVPTGYNLQRGGTGGSVPCSESREKMRQAQTGRKVSEATRERMRKAQQKRPPISEETRERLREAAKRRGMRPQVWEASAQARKGRPLSEQQRQAASERVKQWWADRKREVQGG